MPPSCALLGEFAIGTQVSLLWQHSPNTKRQRVLVLALCLVVYFLALKLTHWPGPLRLRPEFWFWDQSCLVCISTYICVCMCVYISVCLYQCMCICMSAYRVSQKILCRWSFVKIFPQQLRIFSQSFPRPLYVCIYAKVQIFVQLPLTWTELCPIKRYDAVNFYISPEF